MIKMNNFCLRSIFMLDPFCSAGDLLWWPVSLPYYPYPCLSLCYTPAYVYFYGTRTLSYLGTPRDSLRTKRNPGLMGRLLISKARVRRMADAWQTNWKACV